MIRTALFLLAPALAASIPTPAHGDEPSTTVAAPNGSEKKPVGGFTRPRVVIPPPRSGSAIVLSGIPKQKSDTKLRQTRRQAAGTDSMASPLPNQGLSSIPPPRSLLSDMMVGGQPISMQAALYGAITSNPDLVTLREGNVLAASAEAVEVARHFPTSLNPTVWLDYRPITLVPNGTFGTGPGAHGMPAGNGFYHFGQDYIYASIRQPVELGHQTTHRYRIAQAAYDQQKWIVVQAELTALVQTYRFFQTAAYRREKYQLAEELAKFNDHLQETLERRMEANQVQPADVTLGASRDAGNTPAGQSGPPGLFDGIDGSSQPDWHS